MDLWGMLLFAFMCMSVGCNLSFPKENHENLSCEKNHQSLFWEVMKIQLHLHSPTFYGRCFRAQPEDVLREG